MALSCSSLYLDLSETYWPTTLVSQSWQKCSPEIVKQMPLISDSHFMVYIVAFIIMDYITL